MTKNMRCVLSVAAVGLMAVVFAPYAQADTVDIPLSDPSFENNPVAAGATTSDGIAIDLDMDFAQNAFWTEAYTATGDNAVIWHPTSDSFLGADETGSLPSPATGSQCLLITGDWTNTVAVYQHVTVPGGIQPGKTYTATAAFGLALNQGGAGYAIALTDDIADPLAYINPDTNGRIPAGTGLFYDESATFSGDWVAANVPNAIGGNLYLAVVGDGGMAIDNVRLTATDVPEPSALVLLAAGMLALLAYTWRKWPQGAKIVVGALFALACASMAQATPVPFTYIAIPDIQDETDNHPEMLQSDVNWIVSNQTSQNIAYVGQLGDITNASGATEFQTAHNVLFGLNNAGGLAWGTCPGDHDSIPPSGTTNYVASFGPSNFAGQSWYGSSNLNYTGTPPGSFPPGSGASSYQIFQAGGRSYLVLNMEYHLVAPSSAELSWAQGVINNHPGMPTILDTHQYLNANGTLMTGEGTTMWNSLVNTNSQIFMVTCGHIDGATVDSGEAFTTATDAAGKPVFELLSDFQNINSGDGLMRLYQFDEANSAIHVQTYSPYDTTIPYQTDAASQFDIPLDFNARLGAAVPEPSALVLALAGAAALWAYRWLRCRRAS